MDTQTPAALLPDSDWNVLFEWLMTVRGHEYPRQLARELGISRQALARWSNGEAQPIFSTRRYLTLELQLAVRGVWDEGGTVPPEVRRQFDRAGVSLGGERVPV